QHASEKKQTVEWSTGSLFSPPMNSRYQHFNLDGQRPARLFVGTTAPLMINATRDPEFIFNCPYAFTNRYDQADDYFSRPAESIGGRDWRTNFVPAARGLNLDVDLTDRRGRGNASPEPRVRDQSATWPVSTAAWSPPMPMPSKGPPSAKKREAGRSSTKMRTPRSTPSSSANAPSTAPKSSSPARSIGVSDR